jgi:hypothetical protein
VRELRARFFFSNSIDAGDLQRWGTGNLPPSAELLSQDIRRSFASLWLPGTRAEAKFLRLAGTSNDFGLMANGGTSTA